MLVTPNLTMNPYHNKKNSHKGMCLQPTNSLVVSEPPPVGDSLISCPKLGAQLDQRLWLAALLEFCLHLQLKDVQDLVVGQAV